MEISNGNLLGHALTTMTNLYGYSNQCLIALKSLLFAPNTRSQFFPSNNFDFSLNFPRKNSLLVIEFACSCLLVCPGLTFDSYSDLLSKPSSLSSLKTLSAFLFFKLFHLKFSFLFSN